MLTKTSLSAIRALTYLGIYGSERPLSPRHIAEQLGESPTYLAKVVRHLVRARILTAHKGVAGGVVLKRPPREITLLDIVEACQGPVPSNFCGDVSDLAQSCAFHEAGVELHRAVVGVLSRWTLDQLLCRPRLLGSDERHFRCWLEPIPVVPVQISLPPIAPTQASGPQEAAS